MFVASFAMTYTAILAELAAKNWTAEQHEADLSKGLDDINEQKYEPEPPQLPFEIIGGRPVLVFQPGMP
jgi:hypothetical protein